MTPTSCSLAPAPGFTLVELLATMAIATVLFGMVGVAVRGFNGTTNRRGAVGTLMGVFDQARTVAISDGRATYVVFMSAAHAQDPGGSVPPAMWGRAYALFEDPVLVDGASTLVPQQRSAWIYLPVGVAFKCINNGTGSTTALSVTAIDNTGTDTTAFNVPKVGGGAVSLMLPYVKFDATGQIVDYTGALLSPATPPVHVLMFEGTASNASLETFTHRSAITTVDGEKYALDEVVLKPITGRAQYTLDPYYNLAASN